MADGYAPFTRDDINHEDERNSRAEELFMQMLDIPKRIVKKKKKGKETEIVDDDFYPTSKDELQRMDTLMVQVEDAIDDRSDSQFMGEIAFMKDVLAWSKKRHWTIAWWMVVCVSVIACYFFYQAGKQADVRDGIKAWSSERIETEKSESIASAEKTLASYQTWRDSATVQSDVKRYEGYVAEQSEKLSELKAMSSDDFHKAQVKQANKGVWSQRWSALWCLFWIGLYIFSQRPYGYMISKRRIEAKIYSGLRKALFVVAGALVGMAASLKVTEYITTYTDGSKERSSDAMSILAMQLLLLAAAVALVLAVARIVIVIAAIMGLIRNYELIGLAKKQAAKIKK